MDNGYRSRGYYQAELIHYSTNLEWHIHVPIMISKTSQELFKRVNNMGTQASKSMTGWVTPRWWNRNGVWSKMSVRRRALKRFLEDYTLIRKRTWSSIGHRNSTTYFVKFIEWERMDSLIRNDFRIPLVRESFLRYANELISFHELYIILEPQVISNLLDY